MARTISEYIQACEWDSTKFLIFSENVFGNLIYYSHLLPLLISLLFALFVFFKNPKVLATRVLLITTLLLSVWLFFDLILWATEKPAFTMFFWSLVNMIEPMIYAGMLFFMYAFIDGRSLPFRQKLIVLLLLLPTVILASTNWNLVVYDLTNCNREALEGILPFYSYMTEIVFTLWILRFGIKRFLDEDRATIRALITLTTLGVILFLFSFAMGNIVGSLIIDWEMGQYGLFGIPVFTTFLSYIIIKYKTFNIKLIATQVLMATIWLLILGILFIRAIENVRMITAITLILVTVAGDLLIRSVMREVKQREELARLNSELANLIKQRENLVHLVTHKVKGSFTRSKAIFAGILDGTFGEVNEEVKKRAEQGLESDNMGLETVDLVLNVANMQKGIVKYDMQLLDLREVVEKTILEKSAAIEKKGLRLEKNITPEVCNVSGDTFWLKEVVNNLVENSIKYTKAGSIAINLEKKGDKVLLSVIDTGAGITAEDKMVLFTEGGRGKDSVKVNVDSTGYGLYSVKLIIEAHKGRVWAESEGAGKGAQFYVELPLL